MNIGDMFKRFCEDLLITMEKRASISYRYERITCQLNKDFWQMDSKTAHSRYVGSYGRNTATGFVSDVDMIFQLPISYYGKYNSYLLNGQSAVLQDVKNSIRKTYRITESMGDGQVVVVRFDDNITFEIVPGFLNNDNSYKYPDSNNGGKWRETNPLPEIVAIHEVDKRCNFNLKMLCKMARAWKYEWDVPMGGLLIDTLAARFIDEWEYKDKSYLYYDWMTRDFLKYLSDQDRTKNYWKAIGSGQFIFRKGSFESKAKRCYEIALEAIEAGKKGYNWTQTQKWREIYGTKFPQ